MAQALFINPEYVKTATIIDENVEDKIIRLAIIDAQRLHILPKLGTDLYNKYITDINNSTALTGVYKSLMDNYIIPALLKWVLYEVSISMTFKYRNKGIMTQTSDNAQPVDLGTTGNLKDEFKIAANELTQRLIDYLCENSSDYPEYTSNTDGGDISPDDTLNLTPIWLGRGNYCYDKPGKRDNIQL